LKCYNRGVLEFSLLGPLELSRDGEPQPLTGQKQRAVLAILLLRAGEVVSTDFLLDALWGEQPPRTATTSLQNFVSQLRKLVGADVLVTKPPGYVLRVAPEQVDFERFRRLVEAAGPTEPDERGALLRQALSLWRGAPLADLSFEAFAQPEIARLEELRLGALEQRVDADLDAGRHRDLVSELERLVTAHPLRERFRAQLMLALYRAGRQAEALHVYQDARRALIEELGIEPGPALQQLHASILRQESGLDPATRPSAADHCEQVAEAVLEGRVVPVLGADVSTLATQLAERFGYPDEEPPELTRVAQWVALTKGSGRLYEELHELLEQPAAPTAVHRFFAALPPLLRERGVPHQLLVTTGYDLALEQAFLDAGEEFDVVTYVASGRSRGKFSHVRPDGTTTVIDVPNTYATELSLERRTVILKLHGGIDPSPQREWESFVVTEDDYIDYLSRSDVAGAIPVALAARLRRSHFLFLGYGMREWNARLVLSRIWAEPTAAYRSWAVQATPRPLEREFWRRRDVDVVEAPLEEYVAALEARTAAVRALETV
jgi:DNA-binding SARP family transcriptional activator